jgi:putative oxidoreductase
MDGEDGNSRTGEPDGPGFALTLWIVGRRVRSMSDLGLVILRLVVGGLLAGHGSQKLFGWFGGPGLAGTAEYLESIGLRPGRWWALVAALSEFGGGLFTLLGLLNPLGPIGIMASMSVATLTAHRGKPIWATKGGAEPAVTNLGAALAIALVGPGFYSLDAGFALHVPTLFSVIAAVLAGGGVIITVAAQRAGQRRTRADRRATRAA